MAQHRLNLLLEIVLAVLLTTDDGVPNLNCTGQVRINVLDVNEPPQPISSEYLVSEKDVVGDSVVRLSRGGFAASTFEGTLAETNDIKSNDAIGGEDSDIVIQPREAVSLSQGGSTDKGGASSQ